jgi:hypothetical protein
MSERRDGHDPLGVLRDPAFEPKQFFLLYVDRATPRVVRRRMHIVFLGGPLILAAMAVLVVCFIRMGNSYNAGLVILGAIGLLGLLFGWVAVFRARIRARADRYDGRICTHCAHTLRDDLRCLECGQEHTEEALAAWELV